MSDKQKTPPPSSDSKPTPATPKSLLEQSSDRIAAMFSAAGFTDLGPPPSRTGELQATFVPHKKQK